MTTDDPLRSLVLPDNSAPLVVYSPDQLSRRITSMEHVAVFPGSFNPLHQGHEKLRQVAIRQLGLDVVFELSIGNAEKATLTEDEIRLRLAQFDDVQVALTDRPRFVDKSELFPGCPFVVGFDTAIRILDPGFYKAGVQGRDAALDKLLDSGNQFLVGGRILETEGESRFCGPQDLRPPRRFESLFQVIPEDEFRVDLSSTEIRSRT